MDPMELQRMMAAALRSPQRMGPQAASEYPDMQAPQKMAALPPARGVQATMGQPTITDVVGQDMTPMDYIDPQTGLPPARVAQYMAELGQKYGPRAPPQEQPLMPAETMVAGR